MIIMMIKITITVVLIMTCLILIVMKAIATILLLSLAPPSTTSFMHRMQWTDAYIPYEYCNTECPIATRGITDIYIRHCADGHARENTFTQNGHSLSFVCIIRRYWKKTSILPEHHIIERDWIENEV